MVTVRVLILISLLNKSVLSLIPLSRLQLRYITTRAETVTRLAAAPDLATDLLQDFSNSLGPLLNLGDPLEAAKVGVSAVLLAGFFATRAPTNLLSKSNLNAIVDGTYLARGGASLERVYKASKDGWSAIDFHEAVDGKGSAVVVARGITGQTFGGFNPNGWRSTDDYYSSTAAFLWCLSGNRVVKLPVLSGGNCAVFDYATSGPCFGSSDLLIGPPQAAIMGGFAGPDAEDISKSAGNLRKCKSAVGYTYDNDRAWSVRGDTTLVDVEVYVAT